jgi:hypothetical protein
MLAYDFLLAVRPSVFNYLRVDTPATRRGLFGSLHMLYRNLLYSGASYFAQQPHAC